MCGGLIVYNTDISSNCLRWLDRGGGIDLWEPAMGAHDTGWIGPMGLIHGGVPNDKVLYAC